MKFPVRVFVLVGLLISANLSLEAFVRFLSLEKMQSAAGTLVVEKEIVTPEMLNYFTANKEALKNRLEECNKNLSAHYRATNDALISSMKNAKVSCIFWLAELICFIGVFVHFYREEKNRRVT